MRKYICNFNDFGGIDLANELIAKFPPRLKQDLNLMIDIDFISNSNQIENINAKQSFSSFLHNPDVRVIRSSRFLDPTNAEDLKMLIDISEKPYDDFLPKQYIDFLRETNLVVYNNNTNEEFFVETHGHLAAITETIHQARRAKLAQREGKKLPLDSEFIADHINAHLLGEDFGRYRSEYYAPMTRISDCKWMPVHGSKVDKEMEELLDWYNNKSEGLHPIVRSAILHAEFIRIHPFADGNGRTARLLSNYELVKNNFPTITIKARNKDAYIKFLDEAIMDGDITNLVKLFTTRMIARQKLYHERLLESDLGDSERN